MRLRDKVIIVTGSTTGIGEAIARRCVAEGASVLVHGRDAARGKEVVESLGESAALCVADLTDRTAPQQIVAAAMNAWGRIDGIVNNAATNARGMLGATDDELFDRVMGINARTPLQLIRTAVEELGRTRGVVLNIGSINAYCGEPKLLAYSMSKGALMTLSRNLANALGPKGIRINHLNVGWVLTPNEYQLKIDDGLSENWPQEVGPETAVSGRLIEPAEIAAAAVYWLSEESHPISGSVIELEQYPVIGRIVTSWEE
ncbi:MAG: SDR family oxidoreductase [Planctomycetales bacterium]|nr:SDR family oxidoreductase [Planctomycetales bacterium]